jgi:hypothetical protein
MEAQEALKRILSVSGLLSDLPGLIKGVEMDLDLKPGAIPQCAAPRATGPAQTRLLREWIEDQVSLGLYERLAPIVNGRPACISLLHGNMQHPQILRSYSKYESAEITEWSIPVNEGSHGYFLDIGYQKEAGGFQFLRSFRHGCRFQRCGSCGG